MGKKASASCENNNIKLFGDIDDNIPYKEKVRQLCSNNLNINLKPVMDIIDRFYRIHNTIDINKYPVNNIVDVGWVMYYNLNKLNKHYSRLNSINMELEELRVHFDKRIISSRYIIDILSDLLNILNNLENNIYKDYMEILKLGPYESGVDIVLTLNDIIIPLTMLKTLLCNDNEKRLSMKEIDNNTHSEKMTLLKKLVSIHQRQYKNKEYPIRPSNQYFKFIKSKEDCDQYFVNRRRVWNIKYINPISEDVNIKKINDKVSIISVKGVPSIKRIVVDIKDIDTGVYQKKIIGFKNVTVCGDYELTVRDYKPMRGYELMKIHEQELLDSDSLSISNKLSDFLALTDSICREGVVENIIKIINK